MESIVLSSEGREPRAIRAFAEALESHSAFMAVGGNRIGPIGPIDQH